VGFLSLEQNRFFPHQKFFTPFKLSNSPTTTPSPFKGRRVFPPLQRAWSYGGRPLFFFFQRFPSFLAIRVFFLSTTRNLGIFLAVCFGKLVAFAAQKSSFFPYYPGFRAVCLVSFFDVFFDIESSGFFPFVKRPPWGPSFYYKTTSSQGFLSLSGSIPFPGTLPPVAYPSRPGSYGFFFSAGTVFGTDPPSTSTLGPAFFPGDARCGFFAVGGVFSPPGNPPTRSFYWFTSLRAIPLPLFPNKGPSSFSP